MAEPITHWIGGKPCRSSSFQTGPVYNPSTGEQTGTVAFATGDDVDAAINTAKGAFPLLRSMSREAHRDQRHQDLDTVLEHRDEIARRERRSTGRSSATPGGGHPRP